MADCEADHQAHPPFHLSPKHRGNAAGDKNKRIYRIYAKTGSKWRGGHDDSF